jgi:ubiquinone/menaquinone biosynthesis C-methylase UbiE
MVEESVGKQYDNWHQQYAREDDTQSVWHSFVKKSVRGTDHLHNKRIMEIGCGRGGLSSYLSELTSNSSEIYACDFSEDGLKIAKERFKAKPQINWIQQDIQSLSFKDCFFDTIVSCETIEHVKDPVLALRELHRTLKSGGTVFLTCPNYFNFFGLWCIYRSLIGKPYTEGQPYVNYLLLPRLLSWIRKTGFQIDHYHTSDLVLPLRAHYHYFKDRMPTLIRWLGFRSFFILRKP